ncbi:helix-turn-helix domain-containing protein [Granulosicoccus antarcticus]|uniref:helix-turn-helix domain-containing protein n=1 Tax=Granulosicoccus antarcticus TaxID=437505 RepID=UPI000B5A4F28
MITLDIAQAAELLKMSTGALSQKARSGIVKAAKPGRRWVFLEEDLIEYIRSLYRVQQHVPLVGCDLRNTQCQSTKGAPTGGSTSRLRRGKEYDALLGLKTRNKHKNSKTG